MFEKPYVELTYPGTNKKIEIPFFDSAAFQDSVKYQYAVTLTNGIRIMLYHTLKINFWEINLSHNLVDLTGTSYSNAQEALNNALKYFEVNMKSFQVLSQEFLE